MLYDVDVEPVAVEPEHVGYVFKAHRNRPRSVVGLGTAGAAKLVLDQMVALLLLLVLAPVLLLIAAAIVLESRGPLIFRQPRFGRGGVPFDAWKFRTMRSGLCDPSGARQTADDDPRVTRVGRFLRQTSLDELPQLCNVLWGHMALVGPRAHPCGMRIDGALCENVDPRYHRRHDVRPGITGWAQINGSRGAVKTPEMLFRRVSMDLHYISHWSLWLDLKILARTVPVVLSCKQAR